MTEPPSDNVCFSMTAAEQAFMTGNFEDALKHFFVCIIMLPEARRTTYEDQFAAALHGWIALNPDNASRALALYPQIRHLFPTSIRTKMALVRAVQGTETQKWLLHCLPICKDAEELATRWQDRVALRIARVNLVSHSFPQWHMRMMNCQTRNDAFNRAITLHIKNRNTVVFDIGSGCGLLSVLAAKQTNAVVALEHNTVLAKLSKEILKRNGVEQRVQVHNIHSTQFRTTQKADVIVSETLDCSAFGERIIETFLDAHERFAHADTVFIPSKVSVYIRLFSCREIFDTHAQDYGGVRYRSEFVKTGDADPDQPYWCCKKAEFKQIEYLTAPEPIITCDLTSVDDLKRCMLLSEALKITADTSGVAHGFAIFFTADLTGEIVLNSSATRAWDIGIVPFKEPCVVTAGDELDVSYKLVNSRLDLYNDFYPEELTNASEFERLGIRYEVASLDQLAKKELAYATDISGQIAVQCVLDTVTRKKPPRSVFCSFSTHEGTLDQETFFRLEEMVGYKDFIKSVHPSRVRIIGKIFYSDIIHFDSRPNPNAHCGVDLTPLRSFNLRECRDIRLHEREDIEWVSAEFELYDFPFTAEGFREDLYTTITHDVKVPTSRSAADGIFYEFEILGTRNTKLRPAAAFLFPERINLDGEVTLTFDMHIGEMLISLKETSSII
ncbi:unnamed protein product [Caenorhabditis sp. 36 PRJEB53466]|nr:unnamed protein product [Caenorhabditis sp. 36 PRJEB53466]